MTEITKIITETAGPFREDGCTKLRTGMSKIRHRPNTLR